MASLSSDKNGNRTIQFRDADGRRQTIRLGKMAKKTAEAVKLRVEHLVAAKLTGTAPDDETARWVVQLEAKLADRLAAVGLIAKRESAFLGPFLDAYIEARSDWKPNTRRNHLDVRNALVDFFGSDRRLSDITPGDADEWKLHLKKQGAAPATIGGRVKKAKHFFRVAVRKELLRKSPFADVKAPQQVNPDREYFVTREQAQKVLDACPSAEWRLILALSRYGGLRCPSEHLSLKWGHIDWENDRMMVPSPKTEHNPRGAARTVPLFPELRPYLAECFELAEPGSEYVITRYRDSAKNLRTHLRRIIRRAGLEPWERTFQNLRSTRETELAEDYPLHVVCDWIGNSQPVATKHYLQVTDDHFARAAGRAAESGARVAPDTVEALQNAVQHPAAHQALTRKRRRNAEENRACCLPMH